AGSGLFAESPRAEATAAPPPPRRSLFNLVTGVIRSGLPTVAPAEAQPQPQPIIHQETSLPGHTTETVRANVRPAAGDEMGIDIPAFLRRQSS
ncbi:cell division protein FtsZ, partial [Rhodovastum sp. RN2-1]|nr:cell division protein FtsZ [Limobrevibacterium gyesilva]